MILLVFGTGSIVYFASTVTAFIIEGDLRNVLFASRMKKRMKRMQDHVVVCGAGSTGRREKASPGAVTHRCSFKEERSYFSHDQETSNPAGRYRLLDLSHRG